MLYCLFIEMECILLRFPTCVIGSSLAEIERLKIQGSQIKMMLSDCEVRRVSKTPYPD